MALADHQQAETTQFPWELYDSEGPLRRVGIARVESGPYEGAVGLGYQLRDSGETHLFLTTREKWVELIIQLMRALGVRDEEILRGHTGLVIARSMSDVEGLL